MLMAGTVEGAPTENGQETVGTDIATRKIDIRTTAAGTRATEMLVTVTVRLAIDTETAVSVTMTLVIGRLETAASGCKMTPTRRVWVPTVEIEIMTRQRRVASSSDNTLTTPVEVCSSPLQHDFVLQVNENTLREHKPPPNTA